MKSTFVAIGTLAFLFLTFSLYGKDKNAVKAKYYFNHNQYKEAIPYLEKIVDDANDPEMYGQLGECYRLTSNITRATEYYAKAVKLEGCKDAIILQYSLMLMELQKYDSAKKYLLDYQTRNSSDKRAANLIASCASAPQLLKGTPKGEVSFMNFNTNGCEYAPTLWNDKLVFTSDIYINEDKSSKKLKDNLFYRLYYTKCDESGNCDKNFSLLKVTGTNMKEHIGPATFSRDGKKMYYTCTKTNDKSDGNQISSKTITNLPLEIMIASDYDSVNGEFKTVDPFVHNSKDYSVAHPTVSPDGSFMVFTSDMSGGEGGSDLYYCRKGESGEWSAPVNAGKLINTEGDELFPFLSDDHTLYFSSNGLEGMGGLDIFVSKWDDESASFTKPVNLGVPVNSSYDDISLALFSDGRSSYFSSNRPSLKNGDNIYYFNKNHSYLHIKLFDEKTNNPLNVANVQIMSGGESHYITVNKYGEFITPVYKDIVYTVNIGKNGYVKKSVNVNTAKFKDNDTVVQTIKLASIISQEEKAAAIPEIKKAVAEPPLVKNEPPVKVRDSNYYKKPSYLIMSVFDSVSKKPLKNATVSIESEKDNREVTTNIKGKVLTQLIPELQYTFHVSKTGYNKKEITLLTIFGHDEPDTFTEKVALSIAKIVKNKKPKHAEATTDAGEDEVVKTDHKKHHEAIEKKTKLPKGLCSLNGYYAEYNKYEIVETKKYILDSLVQMLKDNPTMRIRIFGHADCRGSAQYNMKLSIARAVTIGKYLVSQGIDPKRLEHKGLGVTKPVVKCPVCNECSEEQHEKNRGFEYTVLHK